MMELIMEMRGVVDHEVSRAMAIHGRGYASLHEGYGVLSEEVYEAEKEVRDFRRIQSWLLRSIHEDDFEALRDALEFMQETATLAACECAQVAAVATKMLDNLPSRDKLTVADVLEAERQCQAAQNPYRPYAGPLGGG